MVFSLFLMVGNDSIMAHYDANNKGEETISSSYGFMSIVGLFVGWVKRSVPIRRINQYSL